MNGRSHGWWAPRLLWFAVITNAIMAAFSLTRWLLTDHAFSFVLAVINTAVASATFAVLRWHRRMVKSG